ncbi:asparagine synthase-related protein [Catellatospora sp. NPDC049133]|uniref:asparagine synthase-related protein n=1 Tax=Catellatospora sp. NPDC049133 TaxID=3155499 RepID=UPI0033FF84C3
MLKAEIAIAAAAGPWAAQHGRWACGSSWIEPFANPALEAFAAETDGGTTIVVRERVDGRPRTASPSDDLTRMQAEGWPADFHIVRLAAGMVTVSAGDRGAAPLYVTAAADRLVVSWWLGDLAPHQPTLRIDQVEAVRYLSRLHRYSTATVWRDVHRVTERASAVWYGGQVRIDLPPPAPHYLARTLTPAADPVAAYGTLLRGQVRARALDGAAAFVEVSGGLDSANVAVAAQEELPGVRAYGLLLAGPAGAQQYRRRQQLLDLLGLDDVTVDAQQYPPLCGIPPRSRNPDPMLEPYQECLDAVVAAAAAAGASAVLTGIGGDELLGLRPAERGDRGPTPATGPDLELLSARARHLALDLPEPQMPAAALYEPTLLAAASRAPVFLRRGIWPINILAAPDVVRFCEWLPRGWRADRRLHRQRLLARGLPQDWPRPHLRENFAGVMTRGMTIHGLRLLDDALREPRLGDLGLIDVAAVRAAADRLAATGALTAGLYEVVNLELALCGES